MTAEQGTDLSRLIGSHFIDAFFSFSFRVTFVFTP